MTAFQRQKIGWLDMVILLSLSAIWGSAFGAIKIAVDNTGPFTVVALRSVLALLAITLYLCFQPHHLPKWRELLHKRLIFVGITGTLAPFMLIAWAELHLPSSLAGLLMGSGPLLTLIGGHYITKDEQMSGLRVLAVLTGLCGVIVLFADGFVKMGTSAVLAQFALVCAAMCYSTSNLSVKPLTHLSPVIIAGSGFFIASFIALPLAFIVEEPEFASISAEVWLALFWLGFVSTAFAFSLRYVLIRRAGAGFTSNVGYLIPLMAVAIGWFALDEEIETVKLIALAVIVVSIIISQRAGVMLKSQSAAKS